MKKNIIIIVLMILTCFIMSCDTKKLEAVLIDFDKVNSPYKHINNGGLTTDDNLPYNIDAITGATMTVEGPGVVTSIPLSIREIENTTEGQVRGLYKDSKGIFYYEGLDLLIQSKSKSFNETIFNCVPLKSLILPGSYFFSCIICCSNFFYFC